MLEFCGLVLVIIVVLFCNVVYVVRWVVMVVLFILFLELVIRIVFMLVLFLGMCFECILVVVMGGSVVLN